MDTSKIIKGVVNSGRYTVTAPIVKEDYGLYLQIEGVELPSTYEVDFSNDEHSGSSVTMIGNSDGVLIPSQFISSGKDVFAFLYHVGVDYGRTIYKFRIPNKVRPDRTDETPTPEEQSTIDQAISALNEAVEQTAQNVTVSATNAQSALNSAFSASADADRAEQARDDAQTYANNASASASQASASATASAQSASEAETARQATTSLVAEAQRYANASEQSATASANSAEQAESAKGVAQSYAQDAQTSATYASLSESTASTKASEASGYASTASQKATEASQSASQALTYKNDAESAKTASQTAQGKAEDAQTAAETAQGLAEDAQEAAETAAASIQSSAAQIATNTADIASLEADRYKAFVTDSASGSIASFPDGADNIPLKSLVVNIDPVQDLHGYDSPWVGGGGKNKLFLTATTTTINGVTFTVKDDGTIVVNGTATADIVFEIWSKAQNGGNVLLPAGQYIVNGGANGGGTSTYRIGSNGFAWSGGTLKTETDSLTFTITENEAQTNIWIQVFNGTSLSNVVFKPMIRLASVTDASFAPYENICPISGWTGVNITATNSNLRGGIDLANDIKARITSAVINTEEKTVSWSYNATHGTVYAPKVPFKENTRYTFIFTVQNASKRLNFRIYYSDGSVQALPDLTTTEKETLAIVTSANKTVLTIVRQAQGGTTKLYYDESGVFEGVLTASDFQQFGRTIPINWQTEAGTVYGARLDVLSGVLRVEKRSIVLDNTKLVRDSGTRYHVNKSNIGDFLSTSFARMNKFRPRAASEGWNVGGTFFLDRNNLQMNAYRDFDTKAEFIEEYGELQLCYTLATPIEIQLTPTEVRSLLGQNNIFADTGDTEVEYRADTKLYIERLTAPDSADMIADSNIVSGQYFMVGNNLYKATANIANGGQIIVGTNATRISLAQALNEINA